MNEIPKNYIILYLLEPFSDKISEILLKVKSVYNLPIVYIAFSNSKKKNVDYHLTNVTPERFVCLINNSDLVLTDSFHGTAFSVNFNKPCNVLTLEKSKSTSYSILTSSGVLNIG